MYVFFSEQHFKKFHSFWLSGPPEKDLVENQLHLASSNPGAGSILISFVLGCAGFFLLVVVLTMVIVTLAREEQIHMTSDAELMVEDCQNLIDVELIEEEIERDTKGSCQFYVLMDFSIKIFNTFVKIIFVPFQIFISLFMSKPLHYIEVI